MKDYFPAAVEVVLAVEGGLVDNKNDPGGVTFKGISWMAVVGLKDENGALEFDLDGDGKVDAKDFELLAKSYSSGDTEKVVDFYREHYWVNTSADQLRWPFCLCLFDAAVNHGPSAAVVMLQKSLGVKADGVMGPMTIDAANVKPDRGLLNRYLVHRARLYFDISAKRGPIFYDGWMSRLFTIQAEALRRA